MSLPDTAFCRGMNRGECEAIFRRRIEDWQRQHPGWTYDGENFTSPDGTQRHEMRFGELSRRQFVYAVCTAFTLGIAGLLSALSKPSKKKGSGEDTEAASLE